MAGLARSAHPRVSVVVGVDGAGRTRCLDGLAAQAGPVLRINPPADLPPLAGLDGTLVLVDDAHRLTDEQTRSLAAAVRAGVTVVVARRPTIHSVAMAELDEAAAAQGRVLWLEPLDVQAVAGLVAATTGRPPTAEAAERVWRASAGLPALAVSLGIEGEVTPALLARVQRRLAMLDPPTSGLASVLALRLDLADSVLRAVSELDEPGFAAAMRTLHDAGLLVPGTEMMVPAVAAALLSDLPAAQRRRVHESVARALVTQGADPLIAAGQMRAARVLVPAAAEVYAAAGDRLRFADPAAALGWYADALESGVDPARVAAGRAEASALIGLAPPADVAGGVRLSLVDGAVAAHHGRVDRSAETLVAVAEPGPLLAVPALVATGRLDEARAAATTAGPAPLRVFAEAALMAATDPAGAVPRFIEAAEAYELNPPPYVLPETPHAYGALVASLGGDLGSAEHLLGRAMARNVGGPVAAVRHRLLLAWVRLRAGRYDTAVAELQPTTSGEPLPGRDGMLRAALAAGLARRSGDIAALREAWGTVEPMLARRTVDVSHVEVLEELSVAAARLRQKVRLLPVLELLDTIVDRLGQPWQVAAGWVRLQVAIAEEDPATADVVAARLGRVCAGGGGGRRQGAQCAAGAMWARVLTGDVEADTVIAAGDGLAAAELPWEGSRLVGQAAIRTSDPSAARRLLEHARELSSAEVVPAEGRAESRYAGLSEREVEVARMVLAGGTHREIGARLFISPKTVEHHVARIRTKLGATNRAEFVATLRTVLES